MAGRPGFQSKCTAVQSWNKWTILTVKVYSWDGQTRLCPVHDSENSPVRNQKLDRHLDRFAVRGEQIAMLWFRTSALSDWPNVWQRLNQAGKGKEREGGRGRKRSLREIGGWRRKRGRKRDAEGGREINRKRDRAGRGGEKEGERRGEAKGEMAGKRERGKWRKGNGERRGERERGSWREEERRRSREGEGEKDDRREGRREGRWRERAGGRIRERERERISSHFYL